MKTDWMNNAKDHNGTEKQRQKIINAAACMNWQKIPEEGELELPMMQGDALNAIVREYRIPRVSHIAHSPALAPYGFVAARGHYLDKEASDAASCRLTGPKRIYHAVDVFAVDTGTAVMALCAMVYAPEEEPERPNTQERIRFTA